MKGLVWVITPVESLNWGENPRLTRLAHNELGENWCARDFDEEASMRERLKLP